jgi:hypothetical protein
MRHIAAVAIAATLALAPAASADPPLVSRPSMHETHLVIHWTLDQYAGRTGGQLILGGCRSHATYWRICRARIDWPDDHHHTTRYRFQVGGTDDNYIVLLSQS